MGDVGLGAKEKVQQTMQATIKTAKNAKDKAQETAKNMKDKM